MTIHNGQNSSLDPHTESTLARVAQQLAKLEKRDWELWLIVCIGGVVISAGLLGVAFPSAFLSRGNVHFELSVSKELYLALIALLILLNVYIVTRRWELRRVREKVITTTIQSELIRLQSFTDPLTEVYNRRSLDDMAGRFIGHARRSHKPLTFVMVDLDRFKQVNTKFGHLTGDLVLADIAGLFRSSVRGCDAVIRYGGDEFLLILADSEREGAEKVIKRINHYLEDWNRQGHLEEFQLSMSFGVAQWRDGMTLDEILDEADKDMYAHKDGHPRQVPVS